MFVVGLKVSGISVPKLKITTCNKLKPWPRSLCSKHQISTSFATNPTIHLRDFSYWTTVYHLRTFLDNTSPAHKAYIGKQGYPTHLHGSDKKPSGYKHIRIPMHLCIQAMLTWTIYSACNDGVLGCREQESNSCSKMPAATLSFRLGIHSPRYGLRLINLHTTTNTYFNYFQAFFLECTNLVLWASRMHLWRKPNRYMTNSHSFTSQTP